MIRLTKLPKPQILIDNETAWKNILVNRLEQGEIPTAAEKARYRHKDIKAVLISETRGKCAYCESKLLHIHHGDVEHIYPKSLAVEKTFEWENLTLACEICNQNKSDRDPNLESIIDPYNTEPNDHLIFVGELLFDCGTPQGINTRGLLDLNRAALIERRRDHLEKIMTIFQTLMRNDIPLATKKVIYSNLLTTEGSNVSPYTGMALAIIELMKTKISPEIYHP